MVKIVSYNLLNVCKNGRIEALTNILLPCMINIALPDMAAKLTSCFSTGLSQRRRYNMDNADNEYKSVPVDEVRKKAESFSDNDILTTTNLVFNPARNETRTQKHSTFERQIPSNEEELPDDSTLNWMFIRTQSTKELVSNSSDLNQADFSLLKVGKHILQLPQLHSSSQDYRSNKNINNPLSAKQQDTRKDMAAAVTTQQCHSVEDESDNISSENIYI